PRGREERKLLALAEVNARRAAEEAAKAAERDVLPALAAKFGLPLLSRIEAVDVSHLGGHGVRVGLVLRCQPAGEVGGALDVRLAVCV
ncbi:MAG TPA: hypothetical protein PKD41_13555, partial [Solidesulfovibrio sp.]|nr:hypothetical protein [Solidesulfovibrio sp.]